MKPQDDGTAGVCECCSRYNFRRYEMEAGWLCAFCYAFVERLTRG